MHTPTYFQTHLRDVEGPDTNDGIPHGYTRWVVLTDRRICAERERPDVEDTKL
jgi:hypothetical protein